MIHPAITVRSHRSGRETMIEVHGWPGGHGSAWTVYSPEHAPTQMRDDAAWDRTDAIASAKRLGRSLRNRRSGAQKGRVIKAYGWHRFRNDVAVAELLLHVETDRPLLVIRFNSSTDLIESERYAVRSLLLACAADIASTLQQELGIDDGWLDWRIPEKFVADVLATSPGFSPVRKRHRPRRRGGDVILRRS